VRNLDIDGVHDSYPNRAVFIQGDAAATGPINATITGSALTNGNSPGGGIEIDNAGDATVTALVENNTISQVTGDGISIVDHDGAGLVNATIRNNSVSLDDAQAGDGIYVSAGGDADPGTATVCASIASNTSTTTAAGKVGIRIRQLGAGTSFLLAGYGGAPGDDAAVQAFLSAGNAGASAAADHAGAGFSPVDSCPLPA
jgi:hypothetical protein